LLDAGQAVQCLPAPSPTRIDRFLSSPQRVEVGTIGGEAGRHLGTLGNGAVAGDQDIDLPGGLTQPVECRLVGGQLIGTARVQERDQDVGEHVAGEQDAAVREEHRGMADGVRLMLDDLARHGSAVRGQRRDEPEQLERDTRRALRRHPLPPLPGFTGRLSTGGSGVTRHVAEPGMPQQVIPVGMGGEPGDHRNAEPVHVIGELVQLRTIDAGIDQDQTILSAYHDGVAPDPRALPDPDAIGHLIQHRSTLSGTSTQRNHAGQETVYVNSRAGGAQVGGGYRLSGVTFEEFAVARLHSLLRYAVVLTGDHNLAQDVVQEVLARAYVRWRRVSESGAPEAYVRRMVLNEYLSWRRTWAVRHVHAAGERLVDLDDARGGVRDPAQSIVDADELWQRLATLGRKQRAVLVLRYYEQMEDDAIADLLSCSPATVRSQASKALRTLRLQSERQERIHAEEKS
jgi:RNA polymerase sigma-70 factor (sigma-E family)